MKDMKSDIIDKASRGGDGMNVPEGYFEQFVSQMSERLPYREELDMPLGHRASPKNSTWMRIRPYVYMAAMFAGAWCLIKMFSLMSPSADNTDINRYPGLSLALEDEQFVDEYVIDGVSTYDILEDSYMYSMGLGDEETDDDALEAPVDENDKNYTLPTDGDYTTAPDYDN